jgi:hypothetical protein
MAAPQGSYRIRPIAARKYGCLLSASAIIQNGPRSMPSNLAPVTLGNMHANGVRMERLRDLIRARLSARSKLSNGGRDAGFSFGACGCLGSLRFNTRRANDTCAGRPRSVISCRRISRLRCMGRLGERATETPLAV